MIWREVWVLSLVVATVSWTVAHEDLFEGLRAWCRRARERWPYASGVFYPPLCAFCFSWWVALALVAHARYGWRLGGGDIVPWLCWSAVVVAVAAGLRTLYELGRVAVANRRLRNQRLELDMHRRV